MRSRGRGKRTELRIRQDSDGRRDVLATLPVTLTDGEQAHDLVIESDRAKGPLAVEVEELPREAITGNNVVPFQITPRQMKLRVIYMEGSPLRYRYIHDALEEDPNIKCVSMEADNMHAERPRLFRIPDHQVGYPTTREELLSYDVVICSDIAGAFSREQLDWTVELVNKRGGGFVMIGGNRSFGSGDWDQTIWDGLIPVEHQRAHERQDGIRCAHLQGDYPERSDRSPIWRILGG